MKKNYYHMKGLITMITLLALPGFVHSQDWHLLGNGGTNPMVNFVGTTDAKPLVFRVNNAKAGYLDFNPLKANTGFGYQSLMSNTSGNSNTAAGYQALFSNTTGFHNTAFGFKALYANGGGYYNTAVGYSALSKNTTGSGNTATGWTALTFNITGVNNTATGYGALYSNSSGINNTATGLTSLYYNTTGGNNTATGLGSLSYNATGNNNIGIGYNALYQNVSGNSNTAIGSDAMYKNIGGSNLVAVGDSALYNQNGGAGFNTALGSKSLYANISGFENTAVGYHSLYSNTTGTQNTAVGSGALQNNATGIWNTAVGYQALINNTGSQGTATGFAALSANSTGQSNTADGFKALVSNTTGSSNTATGNNSLVNNTTGSYNIAIGQNAMSTATTESFNTAIGYVADIRAGANGGTALGAGTIAAYSNSTAVGNGAVTTAPDQVMLGNTTLTSVWAAGSYVIYSDGRFKKNIRTNVPGLEFINQLKPVTYNYDIHKLNDYIHPGKNNAANAGLKSNAQEAGITAKEKISYTGFIAQDVEATASKLNYDFSGVHKPQNDKDPYGLSYSDFVVPLVKAVQELSAKNEDLQKQVDELKAIKVPRNQLSQATNNQTVWLNDNPSLYLEQNVPNPFKGSTTIKYNVPSTARTSQIIITGVNGKVIKSVLLTPKGDGQLTISTSSLASGIYFYSLLVDGKKVETKKMELQK